MGGDLPTFSERELAQRFLIDNISDILLRTNRVNGFPGVTDLLPQETVGPTPVAIARVVNNDRDRLGKTTKSTNTGDLNTLITAFTPQSNLDFLNIPGSILDQLQPKVELYKVYLNEATGEETDTIFESSWEEWKDQAVLQGKQTPKVGMTGITINKMGGNPAEVDSNIEVSLRLTTMDLNNLFYRYDLEDGNSIAWIDLIKMKPSLVQTSNDDNEEYDINKTRIKMKISYNEVSNSIIEGAIGASLKTHQENLERARRAQAPPEVIGEIKAAIEAENLSVLPDTTQNIIDAINNHEEIYYLALRSHDIIVNSDLTISMTINFIGYAEALQRTDDADLLNIPHIRRQRENKAREIQELQSRIGALQDVPVESVSGPAQQEEVRLENSDRERCREEIQKELADLQNKALVLQIEARSYLYKQLVLGRLRQRVTTTPSNPEARRNAQQARNIALSRVYMIKMPAKGDFGAGEGWNPSVRAADLLQAGVDNSSYYDVINYAHRSILSLGNLREPHIGGEYNTEMNDELATPPEDLQRVGRDVSIHHRFKLISFVFLGDILEAALEIVAHNTGLTSRGRPLPFFRESGNTANFGPAAQKTIKQFGRYIFGDIALPRLEGEDDVKYVNIADIPIDIEYFRTFWFNEVVSKPQMTKYYLKNLINGMVNKLLPYALRTGRIWPEQAPCDPPPAQVISSYFTLMGGDNMWEDKSAPAVLVCDEPRFFFADSPDHWGTSGGKMTAGGCESFTSALAPTGQVQSRNYFNIEEIRKRISETYLSSGGTNAFNVFVIHQKPLDKVLRTGDKVFDKDEGIHHFNLKGAVGSKGVLLSAQFKRNDLPALQVANLFSDQGSNRLGIMREKYDATMLMRGNVVYKPGSVLYLDPNKFQNEPIEGISTGLEGEVINSVWPQIFVGRSISPAQALGLGGYYVVITVQHELELARSAKWRTTLDTKWISFAHDEDLPSCSSDEERVAIAEENERCVQETQQQRTEVAEDIAELEAYTGYGG